MIKKIRLAVGALMIALLAFIALVPSQAAPRSYVFDQKAESVVEMTDVKLQTSDVVCPAMIFRNINDYPAMTGENFGNQQKTVNQTKFYASLSSTRFDEILNRIRWKHRALSRFTNEPFPNRFDIANRHSVFENRKNKSSPLKQ